MSKPPCSSATRGFISIGLAGITALASFGCDDGGPRVPARVIVSPDVVLVGSIGDTEQFEARVLDADGSLIPGVAVSWSSSDESVADIDAASGRATAAGAGVATITATAEPATGRATFEVFLAEETDYVPGESYYGRRQYTEYIAGDLPIVLSAPHGGYEEPDEIPDRTWGVVLQDRRTQELARTIGATIHERTGGYPHIIISRLHRVKLDPNREIDEAAQGNLYAEWAWGEYHDFIETAKAAVVEQVGRGLYLDLHGHGHEFQRLELGYLLSASDLELSDAELAQPAYVNKSSIRTLAQEADAGFAELVRGSLSLGGLLDARGFPSVPSPVYPDPGGHPYYSGGYNTARHGSREGGPISGAQVEANWEGVRDNTNNREAFAAALAEALEVYLSEHFGIDIALPLANR
ncbi:MAG: Ig-like domain-containing protein [Gemmatimonadales bacterium]